MTTFQRPPEPEHTVTVDGIDYVPKSALHTALDDASTLRGTLAAVHMHLVLGNPEAGRERAVARIAANTGWTIENARAVASVVAWAKDNPPG